MWTRIAVLLTICISLSESAKGVKCVYQEPYIGYNWKLAKSCFVLFTITQECQKSLNFGATRHSPNHKLNEAHLRQTHDDHITVSYECKEDFCNTDKDSILKSLENLKPFESEAENCKELLIEFAENSFLTPVNNYIEEFPRFFERDVEDLVAEARSKNLDRTMMLNPDLVEEINIRLAETHERRILAANQKEILQHMPEEVRHDMEKLKKKADHWAKILFGATH